ncbi:hypothetical protein DRQ20_02585 [bacterium]|nr:MAG: hypothetical protein DRQ20_02585 [bacterium]
MMLFIFFTLSWDEVTQECDKWFQVFLDGIRGWFTGQNEEPPWEVSRREWGGVTPVKIEVWISNPKDYYLTCEPIYLEWKVYNTVEETVRMYLPHPYTYVGHMLMIWGAVEEDGKPKMYAVAWRGEDDLLAIKWPERLPQFIAPGETIYYYMDIPWESWNLRAGTYYLKYFIFFPAQRWESRGNTRRPVNKPHWWGYYVIPIDFKAVIKPPEGVEKEVKSLIHRAHVENHPEILEKKKMLKEIRKIRKKSPERYDEVYRRVRNEIWRIKLRMFLDIVKKYPDSRYIPLILGSYLPNEMGVRPSGSLGKREKEDLEELLRVYAWFWEEKVRDDPTYPRRFKEYIQEIIKTIKGILKGEG